MSKDVPVGYKLTEVGVIPEDWEVKSLKFISDKIMVGIASAATHAYRDKGIVLLRNQNIKSGYLDDKDILHIDPEYERTFKNKRLVTGDLLTARTGYPGTTCVVPEKYESAQSFTTLITRVNKSAVNSEFLCHYINSEQGQSFFEQNQIGGGQKNVNAASLKEMPIVLPSSAEQEAIALVLSDADALITSLDKLIAKKRDIKQAAMQQLLTGKQRLEGFGDSSGKFKQTEIGLIPEDWDIKRVGDICDFIVPGRNKPRIFEGDIPWITTPDLEDGRSVSKSRLNLYISKDEAKNVGSKIVPTGSVIMSCVGELGIVALTENEIVINQQLHAFISSSIIDGFFF